MSDDEKLINELVNDREKFESFIYTPIGEVYYEFATRDNNPELEESIKKYLNNDIPEQFSKKRSVILRHIITPSYEISRFFHLTDLLEDQFTPLFAEFPDDILVPSNVEKKALGKISFYQGVDRNGFSIFDRMQLIDFESSNGKKFSEIKTLHGDLLVDFHHKLFKYAHSTVTDDFIFNISSWYYSHGPSAVSFYSHILCLFVKHGVLFENYMFNDASERKFIKEIFLPSFIKVMKITGKKPIIIPLEPTDMEDEKFWFSYPSKFKEWITSNLISKNND